MAQLEEPGLRSDRQKDRLFLVERTDMFLWYGIRGSVDKKLSAGLEALKKTGYPFETKIFTDLGHGGLAGEHPEEFLQEVQAARLHSLER